MAETILLVDDEAGVRKVLGLVLRDLGFATATAGDGREALEKFRELKPAMIVTDLRMPVMDGLALLKAVKALDPDVEVIVVTGHGDMEQAVEALKLGAADFIAKPVSDEVLEIAVKRAAQKIAVRRELKAYTERLETLAAEQAERIVDLERQSTAGQAAAGVAEAMAGLAGDLGEASELFNEMPCFTLVHAPNLTIVSQNELSRKRFGDLTGKPSSSALAGGAKRQGDCPAAKVFASGKGSRGRETLKDAAGRTTPVVVYAAPIRDGKGRTALVIEIAADLDEVDRLHLELQSTKDHLASLGMVVAGLSHGVKGLLTAMDGAVYMVDAGLLRGDQARVAAGWAKAKELFGRIRSLVLDILLAAKKRRAEFSRIDAVEFAVETAGLVEPKALCKGVPFLLDVLGAPGSFDGDKTLLSAALVNLLENAVEASLQGDSPKPGCAVVFSVKREGSDMVFSVQDDGVGMDEETRKKLFHVFFSTKGSKGTGLGLFIAKHAAAGHGGTVEVESTLGEGSRFIMRIPSKAQTTSA